MPSQVVLSKCYSFKCVLFLKKPRQTDHLQIIYRSFPLLDDLDISRQIDHLFPILFVGSSSCCRVGPADNPHDLARTCCSGWICPARQILHNLSNGR